MRLLRQDELISVQGSVFIVAGWLFVTSSSGIPELDFIYIDENVGLYLNNLITLETFGARMDRVSETYLNQYYYNFQFVTMTYIL
jgi:hypothetical protein